jgi:hypothetical protein
MSVINNIYLLPTTYVNEENARRIQDLINELAEDIFSRQKEKKQYFSSEWFQTLFQLNYTSFNRFLGDTDYFFEFNEGRKDFQLSEYAKDEIREVICPNCQYALSNELGKALLYNGLKNTSPKLAIECELGILCPKCGVLTNINRLMDKKLIGNFSIHLAESLFYYTNVKEIFSYLNQIEDIKFTVKQYMYP